MKTAIQLPPVQRISLANRLRLMAAGTRVVHDQAELMLAAQLIERQREALTLAQATIERLTVKHGQFSSTQGTMDVVNAVLTSNP